MTIMILIARRFGLILMLCRSVLVKLVLAHFTFAKLFIKLWPLSYISFCPVVILQGCLRQHNNLI